MLPLGLALSTTMSASLRTVVQTKSLASYAVMGKLALMVARKMGTAVPGGVTDAKTELPATFVRRSVELPVRLPIRPFFAVTRSSMIVAGHGLVVVSAQPPIPTHNPITLVSYPSVIRAVCP